LDSFSPATLLDIAVALLALCLPGTALYMVTSWALGRNAGTPWAAFLPGVGLSVAFWPLLLLYCSLLGARFTPALIWAVLGLSLAVIVLIWLAARRRERPSRDEMLTALAIIAMTLLALALRLGDINGLAVPMFGDSLHHTMITSIIAATGRVPTGYQPYIPVDTFTYHFGFHTLAALLAMVTGRTPPDAVLIMGQALNAMSVPVAYLFARQLFASRTVGLAAALITGFVSVMPAYYVNWGRYTQLAGLLLLPVACTLLLRAVRRDAKAYEVVLAAFCVGSLVVVHYRILIFYALFALAMGAWLVIANRKSRTLLRHALRRAALAVAGGILLASPWVWNLATNYLPGLARRLGTVSPDYISIYNSNENFTRYVGLAVAILGMFGLGAALWRAFKDQGDDAHQTLLMPTHYAALGIATWVALLFASLWAVPGAIGSLTVAIALYIPLSALGGYGIAAMAGLARARWTIPAWGVPLALVIAAPLLAFALRTWHVADPAQYSYVRDADLRAFDWIKVNTPPTAKFLISSQISYAGRAVTASDAGMWLPLLTGRGVSVPALAAWTEHPLEPDFFDRARTLAAYSQPQNDPEIAQIVARGLIPAPLGPGDPKMLDRMREMGITHVYSGTAGGASRPRLNVAAMRRDNCHYRLIRPPEEGVYVFQVNYQCP
jgi:hypothetical protein